MTYKIYLKTIFSYTLLELWSSMFEILKTFSQNKYVNLQLCLNSFFSIKPF